MYRWNRWIPMYVIQQCDGSKLQSLKMLHFPYSKHCIYLLNSNVARAKYLESIKLSSKLNVHAVLCVDYGIQTIVQESHLRKLPEEI